MFGTPEQQAEAMRLLERGAAESDLTGHQIVRVIHELDAEQCFVVGKVLKWIRDADTVESRESVIANYWIGVLAARLHVFGVCQSCGKNHDEEALRMSETGEEL